MCQRKTADKHALQAFKETCDEAATELPPGWKNAFQLFCADSSETTSHGARWAAFKADNGGTGGEYDEMARVARLEYLQAHAEALERFHSSATSVPAWERAQQLRDADAGGGGGGGGGDGRSSGVGNVSGAGSAGGLQPPSAAAAPGKKRAASRSVAQMCADAAAKGKVMCEWCRAEVLDKNLPTHKRKCKRKPEVPAAVCGC